MRYEMTTATIVHPAGYPSERTYRSTSFWMALGHQRSPHPVSRSTAV